MVYRPRYFAPLTITTEAYGEKSVTEGKLDDGSVTTPKIANKAVTTNKIADRAVTAPKLSVGAVTTEKIADASVTPGKLTVPIPTRPFVPPISTGEIADGAITKDKMADKIIGTDEIQDGAVTRPKIAPDSVDRTRIAANAVTGLEIAPGAVSTTELSTDAVETPKIKDGAVTEPKLAPDAIGTARIKDGAVTTPKISDGAVTSPKIGTKEVKGINIDDEAIDTDKLEDGAVTKPKLADASASPPKLEAIDTPADDEVPTYDAATGKFEWKTPYRPSISEPAPGTNWAMFFRGYSWGRVGELITLQLRCKNIPIPAPEEWAGWQTDFTYDQTKMTLESWAWGDYPEPKLDMGGPVPPNQWFGAQATTAPGPYPSDPGEAGMKLLTLGFRLTAPGIANLSFNPPACKYMDKVAVSYPADTLDASITIV